MLEDEKNEQEKFDFTSDGEERGYISLDQAVLQARQQAQEDGERYRVRLGWDEIVWSEISSEERENTFQKFSSEGVFMGKWGTEGTGDGQFDDPRGIAVASDGSVYVADSGNNRIQKFSVVR